MATYLKSLEKRALPKNIQLLFPTDIPSESEICEATLGGRLRTSEIDRLAAGFPARERTSAQIGMSLTELLRELPQRERLTECVSPQSDDAAHDAYFCISRVSGDAPAIFLRMVYTARRCLLDDVMEFGITMDPELLSQIDEAFVALTDAAWGGTTRVPSVKHWEVIEQVPAADGPMKRWIRGHQIFATLSQGLIFSFLSMGRAIKLGDRVAVRRWAEISIRLLEGSGAAFVFTGDFSIEEYMAVIRPTMMPPVSETNLSGLMSLDHRVLVQTMRDMKPALLSLHEQEPDLHGRLQQEMATVYDRHIHVCERFVGERPSLLTAHVAKKSGPSLIEQFKTLRMKTFDAPVHAHRLSQGCPVGARGDAAADLTLVEVTSTATDFRTDTAKGRAKDL
jgi:hypothetical protein